LRAYELCCDSARLLLRFSGDGVFVCFGQRHGRARLAIPFDDEIATLLHQRANLSRIFPATTDVHPPFSYLMFYGLR
jgi:hypothetical protein